jgi:hypothetical protein
MHCWRYKHKSLTCEEKERKMDLPPPTMRPMINNTNKEPTKGDAESAHTLAKRGNESFTLPLVNEPKHRVPKGALQPVAPMSSTRLPAMKWRQQQHPCSIATTGKLNPNLPNTNLVA